MTIFRRPVPLTFLAVLTATGCSDFSTAPTATPAEIRVTPDTVRVMTGEAAAFEVVLLDENGEPYRSGPAWAPPLFTPERPERVTVEPGSVTPLKGGANRLEVELGGLVTEVVLEANPSQLDLSVPMVYVTQSAQRTKGDVALVAGRAGLLRVVVQGDDENYYRPTVRAVFRHGGEVVHTATMNLEEEGIPTRLDEGDLDLSYDAAVPGDALRPGTTLVLEIDGAAVPVAHGSTTRVPATGEMALNVVEVPRFRLMMVPVTLAANDGRTSRLTPEFADRMTELTEEIFPFADFEVEVREPYVTDRPMDTVQGWYDLIKDLRAVRYADGNPHYYYGGFDRPTGTNIGGLGYVGFPVAIGMDNRSDIIAHEIGHNLSLPHAPCGEPADPDPDYPHEGGVIGIYGYERRSGTVHRPEKYDLMSYCDPIWISDYNYENVLEYRETSPYDGAFEGAGAAGAALAAPEGPMLVVRGGVRDGRLSLEPGLVLDGPAIVPTAGEYTLEGLDAAGAAVFSVPVNLEQLDHADASQFLVALPLDVARPDRLEVLRIMGPEGTVVRPRSRQPDRLLPTVAVLRSGTPTRRVPSATMTWDASHYPLAVLRDRTTGRIQAMSASGRVPLPEGADPSRFEVLLSDGIRTHVSTVEIR